VVAHIIFMLYICRWKSRSYFRTGKSMWLKSCNGNTLLLLSKYVQQYTSISQLIRYARASSNYSDFLKRHLHLRNRLLDQGYEKIRLIRSLKQFIFLYQDLVEIYSVSAEKIINDEFSYSENV
jgi:hypothetical protein